MHSLIDKIKRSVIQSIHSPLSNSEGWRGKILEAVEKSRLEMVFETKGKGKKDAIESVGKRNSLRTSKIV